MAPIFRLMAHLIEVITMNLLEIERKVSSLPTIIDISDEINIIKNLMRVSYDDLNENMDIFKSIISSLEMSHADIGFMELNCENENIFVDFCLWLKKINSDLNFGIGENTMDVFSLTVEDVKRLMS